MKPSFAFVVATIALRTAAALRVGQVVNTTSGPVQGRASQYNFEVSEYLNIPFAHPPVGNLRWAAPLRFSGTALINGTVPVSKIPDTTLSLQPLAFWLSRRDLTAF
jgi:hypothetical protein